MNKFRWSLLVPEDRVLVAVSGGPDSLSLLHILHTQRQARGLETVQAAYLDHGLRGEESAAEAAWVKDWCAEQGIPCHLGKADVGGLARKQKRSKQEAARAARYAFLDSVAARMGATKIATGHTQDDQAETVLLNILRGTGLDGLRGIPSVRDLYVRPLLDTSRSEIEAYCAEYSLTPRHDPSNLSADNYTRNKVRLELLPLLAREYNPAVTNALLRLSESATRDSDYLHEQAEAALARVTREQGADCLALDRHALAALHPALLRHVLRLAVGHFRGTREGITYEHVEAICQAIAAELTHAFALTLPSPRCVVRVREQSIVLTLPAISTGPGSVSVILPVPGEEALPKIGWGVQEHKVGRPGTVTLDADTIHGRLTLRTWRTGDKIAPLGMDGHTKKVSDIFTDAKVPREERHRISIVADEESIVWVAGHSIAERVKVTPGTTRILHLTAIPIIDAHTETPCPERQG